MNPTTTGSAAPRRIHHRLFQALAGLLLLLLLGLWLWGWGPCFGEGCDESCCKKPIVITPPPPTPTTLTPAPSTGAIPTTEPPITYPPTTVTMITTTAPSTTVPTTSSTIPLPPKPAPLLAPIAVHFSFDERAPILDEGALLSWASKLDGEAGASVKEIHIVGHACRIGPREYNEGLSVRRADEVLTRLKSVLKRHDLVFAPVEGKGFSQPTSDTEHCVGKRPFAALRECLSPDRRVVVTPR